MMPSGLGSTATVVIVLVAYLVVLLVIAWRAACRTHGGEDFHLAGRSLGAWAAGISSTASSESGWVTLGAVGMTYTYGVSGLWYAPGCLLGYVVNLYVVAPRLRRMSKENGSITLADVISQRWGDPHHLLRLTATAIILLFMMAYVAAQMTAAGKAFVSTLSLQGPTGYLIGVILGAVVITAVTLVGGFRSVAWTDLFQGLLMAAALIALPLYAIAKLGGFGPLFSVAAIADPDLLTASGGRVGSALIGFVVGQLGIGLGYPGMPHVVNRYMATRDEKEMRRLIVIAMLWGVVVFYGAGLIGLAARVMLPQLPDGEQALMVLSLHLLHPILAGLMLAAVMSAILSTVSSQLLVAASAVSYDLAEKAFGLRPDDHRSLVFGRWTVAAVGLLAIAIALGDVRLVFWFVLFAWSGLGACFAPLVLFALGDGSVNRHGALAAMLTGFGVTIAWNLGRDPSANPRTFAAVPVVTLAVAAAFAFLLHLRRALEPGVAWAVATAAVATLAGWGLVQLAGLHHLYELVPAFGIAAAAALLVSRLAPVRDDPSGATVPRVAEE